MPTSIELPHCSVAIVNKGQTSLFMSYNQKSYEYPKGGKPVVVPFEVAHKHFGFELRGAKLFRNTSDRYDSGDETAFYVARATYLPWGWEHQSGPITGPYAKFDHVFNPHDPEKEWITKAQAFRIIKDTFERRIEGRLIALPETMNAEQFEALPA